MRTSDRAGGMSGVTRSRLRRVAWARQAVLLALCALVALPVVALGPSRTADAGVDGLAEVARVAFPPDPDEFSPTRGRLVLDEETRRGFRLFRDAATGSLGMWALNLDTLADGPRVLVADFPAAPAQKFGYFAAAGGGRLFVVDEAGWVHAFDQVTLERVGLFPSILPPPSGSTVLVLNRENAEGARRNTPEGERTALHPFTSLPGHRITAFEYVPSLRAAGGPAELLTVSHGYVNEADVPVSVLTLHRWDAMTGREISATRLDGCSSGRSFGNETRASAGLALSTSPSGGRELVFGCIGRGLVGEVWRAALAEDGTIRSQMLAGSVATASDFLIDPIGRRAHAITSSGVGQSFVTVDLDRGGVVGSVGLSFDFDAMAAPAGVGAAIDPSTGRLYALAGASLDEATGKTSPGGLVLVDGRRSPLPQGFAFTDLSRDAVEMVAVDRAGPGRATRVFIRRVGEPFYRVLNDQVAVQSNPGLADADRFTTDVEEVEDVTRAAFSGGVTGYGVRMLLVGGTSAVPDPVSLVRGESLTKDTATGFVAAPGCGGTNRELILGSIASTTGLSDTAATAEAIAAHADPRTIQDLAEPVGSCSPSILSRTTIGRSRSHPDDFTLGSNAWRETTVPGTEGNADQLVGPSWPFSTAVCLPPARPKDAAPHDGDGLYPGTPPPAGFSARTDCDLDAQKLTAGALAAGADLAGIRVSKAESQTEMSRSLGKGVTVTVTSKAAGLELPGDISIAEVRATAVASAGGRPGTATTSFTSAICGLRAPGLSISACFDPRSAQARQIISGLNQVLGQRQMSIRLPDADPELLAGTPGGALAAVQKDRFATQGEQLFNNDFLTALPALELVRLHDSTQGRGRQIIQVAGVQASTAYNISVKASDTGGVAPPAKTVGSEVLVGGTSPTLREGLPQLPGTDGGFPTPGQMLSTILATTSYILRWALRSPGKALSVIGLLGVAFALPLHLLERSRAFAAAMTKKDPA